MSTKTINIDEKLYEYLLNNSLREPKLLKKLREETALMPSGLMQISPEQGQFMGLLVRLIGIRRILEIGVFTGYSSLSMALALPEDGAIVACDISEEYTDCKKILEGSQCRYTDPIENRARYRYASGTFSG